ncbi:hypothetical protein Tco_0066789 [Tanacetum coccineum]
MIGGLFQNHASTSGTLPSNTIPNLKGSTAQIPPPVIPISIPEPDVPKTLPKTTPILEPDVPKNLPKPNIPYPSRLNQEKSRDKASNQKEKIFQMFQDLRFDISFADALLLMPRFAPTIKSLLMNKEKLLELAKIPLNENCSAMLLKKLPEKLGDPGNTFSAEEIVPIPRESEIQSLSENDKIDAFLVIKVPTYIEEGYYDSEGDVLYLESLLSDDNTHNLSSDVFFDHEPQHIKNESNHDTLITFSPKNDPLHYEFAGGVITIPPGIVREHEDYINRMSLLCGNSSSRSPENFHTIIEDSDSNREEIDIFSGPDDSIPPGIESDIDSEEDIIDNLLNDDPIPEYERLTFDMEPDVPVINNVDELNEDECFDPGGGEINVEVDDSFTFVIQTFLPYLTYPEVSPLLSSTENEDTIFDPGIST